MTPDWYIIALLCVVAAAAGWVDAVSGGGGLLQLPALLLVTPADQPATALGTNKLSSIFGTSAAAITYGRIEMPRLRTALPMAAAAFVGAAFGSLTAIHLPPTIFRPIILVALVVVWMMWGVRDGMIMSPPLTFGRDDIDKAVGIAKMALDKTAADLGIQ